MFPEGGHKGSTHFPVIIGQVLDDTMVLFLVPVEWALYGIYEGDLKGLEEHMSGWIGVALAESAVGVGKSFVVFAYHPWVFPGWVSVVSEGVTVEEGSKFPRMWMQIQKHFYLSLIFFDTLLESPHHWVSQFVGVVPLPVWVSST